MAVPGMLTASVILYGKRNAFNTFTLLNIFLSLVSMMTFHYSIVNLDADTGFNYALVSLVVNGFFL